MRDVRTRLVDVGDVTLAVDEWAGTVGRPVLFLHATGFSRGVWRPAAGELAARCRPFAVDLRGHGGSSTPAPPYTFDELRRDVLALIEREHWSGLVICGHSVGGSIAVEVAIERPELVAGLVLVEAPLMDRESFREGRPVVVTTLVERTLKRRWQWGTRAEASAYLRARAPYDSWDRECFDGWIETGLRERGDGVELACTPQIEAATFGAAGQSRAYALLPELRCPVWVGRGDGDRGMPSTTGGDVAGRTALAFESIAHGDGHFAPLERPGWVVELVGSALDYLEVARRDRQGVRVSGDAFSLEGGDGGRHAHFG